MTPSEMGNLFGAYKTAETVWTSLFGFAIGEHHTIPACVKDANLFLVLEIRFILKDTSWCPQISCSSARQDTESRLSGGIRFALIHTSVSDVMSEFKIIVHISKSKAFRNKTATFYSFVSHDS